MRRCAILVGWPPNLVPQTVRLLRLASEQERPQLAAARHSENWYDFSGREVGPAKGMAFREARAVPEFGGFMTQRCKVERTRPAFPPRECRADGLRALHALKTQIGVSTGQGAGSKSNLPHAGCKTNRLVIDVVVSHDATEGSVSSSNEHRFRDAVVILVADSAKH
jgi:hypothetical protein